MRDSIKIHQRSPTISLAVLARVKSDADAILGVGSRASARCVRCVIHLAHTLLAFWAQVLLRKFCYHQFSRNLRILSRQTALLQLMRAANLNGVRVAEARLSCVDMPSPQTMSPFQNETGPTTPLKLSRPLRNAFSRKPSCKRACTSSLVQVRRQALSASSRVAQACRFSHDQRACAGSLVTSLPSSFC